MAVEAELKRRRASDQALVPWELEDDGSDPVRVKNALVNVPHDVVELDYIGDDVSEVRFLDEGELVLTLSLSYTNGKLTRVERS